MDRGNSCITMDRQYYMSWKNTLLSRTDCVRPQSLDISAVYEFYIVLNCSQLCCFIEENEGNMLDV
jgi:hypothetical protein